MQILAVVFSTILPISGLCFLFKCSAQITVVTSFYKSAADRNSRWCQHFQQHHSLGPTFKRDQMHPGRSSVSYHCAGGKTFCYNYLASVRNLSSVGYTLTHLILHNNPLNVNPTLTQHTITSISWPVVSCWHIDWIECRDQTTLVVSYTHTTHNYKHFLTCGLLLTHWLDWM